MVRVSGRPSKLPQRSLSADDFFIAGISLNDLAVVFSPTLMFHCSASRDTGKQYSRAMS